MKTNVNGASVQKMGSWRHVDERKTDSWKSAHSSETCTFLFLFLVFVNGRIKYNTDCYAVSESEEIAVGVKTPQASDGEEGEDDSSEDGGTMILGLGIEFGKVDLQEDARTTALRPDANERKESLEEEERTPQDSTEDKDNNELLKENEKATQRPYQNESNIATENDLRLQQMLTEPGHYWEIVLKQYKENGFVDIHGVWYLRYGPNSKLWTHIGKERPMQKHEEELLMMAKKLRNTIQIKRSLWVGNSKTQEFFVSSTRNGVVMGDGIGRFITRSSHRGSFYHDMQEPGLFSTKHFPSKSPYRLRSLHSKASESRLVSHLAARLAFDLLTPYGYLKQEIKNHCARKGNGAWGDELDTCDFILLELLVITAENSFEEWAGSMIQAVAEAGKSWGKSTCIMVMITSFGWRPTIEASIVDACDLTCRDDDALIKLYERKVALFRSLGFRRVGATDWFGLSTDLYHEAQEISVDGDFDPPRPRLHTPVFHKRGKFEELEACIQHPRFLLNQQLVGDVFSYFQEKAIRQEWEEERNTLISIARFCEDTDCRDRFISHHSIQLELRDSAVGCDSAWQRVDRSGNNVLHITASLGKHRTVQWLMQNIDGLEKLSLAHNCIGYTPLELLQAQLEISRVQKVPMHLHWGEAYVADSFTGFPSADIACIASLYHTHHLTRDEFLQAKYGCTCGLCLEGYLSPRMRITLATVSAIFRTHFSDHETNGIAWLERHMPCLADIGSAVRPYVFAKGAQFSIASQLPTDALLRKAVIFILRVIWNALRGNTIPNDVYFGKVSSGLAKEKTEEAKAVRHFLSKGGKFENVFKMIIKFARKFDAKLNNKTEYQHVIWEADGQPVCRNDLEYGMVAKAMGIRIEPVRHFTEGHKGLYHEESASFRLVEPRMCVDRFFVQHKIQYTSRFMRAVARGLSGGSREDLESSDTESANDDTEES